MKISSSGAGSSTLIEPHDEIAKEIFRVLGKNQIFPHITIYNPKDNKHGPHITQKIPGNRTQREYMRYEDHRLGIPPRQKTIKLLQNIYKLMEKMEKTDRANRKIQKQKEKANKEKVNINITKLKDQAKAASTSEDLNKQLTSLLKRETRFAMKSSDIKYKNLANLYLKRRGTKKNTVQNLKTFKQIMKVNTLDLKNKK